MCESNLNLKELLSMFCTIAEYATHALAHLTPQAQAIVVVYAEKTTIVDK